MKVKDLIEKLNAFHADSQVLVQGYETGYDSIVFVKKIAVIKHSDAADYDGEYDDAENDAKDAVKTVVIMGNRR